MRKAEPVHGKHRAAAANGGLREAGGQSAAPTCPGDKPKRRLLGVTQAAGLTVSAIVVLAGCSSAPTDVVSLDQPAPSSRPATASQPPENRKDQVQAAYALARCLQDAGLTASVDEHSNHSADIALVTDLPYQMIIPGQAVGLGVDGGLSAAQQQAIQSKWGEMMTALEAAGQGDRAVLFVGEEDYSAAFNQCIEATGFVAAGGEPIDPAEELREKQATARANATWAKCARDNGFPALPDPDPPVAYNGLTSPTVVLPKDISEEQLRALVLACPTFDREAQVDYDRRRAQGEQVSGQPPVRPVIEIELPPGFEWDPADPDYDRLYALNSILAQDSKAYFEDLYGTDGKPGVG